MTRITLSELRSAIRDSTTRRVPPEQRPTIPTPFPMASSAIRRFHREGASAARTYLSRTITNSGYWGPAGPPHARGWARVISESFDNYVELAADDPRPEIGSPVTHDVTMGDNTIGVRVDVVLLDDAGYLGRYALWDAPMITENDAQLIAGPIVAALGEELGSERVVGAEVWHLRTSSAFNVDAAVARAREAQIVAIAEQFLSEDS